MAKARKSKKRKAKAGKSKRKAARRAAPKKKARARRAKPSGNPIGAALGMAEEAAALRQRLAGRNTFED